MSSGQYVFSQLVDFLPKRTFDGIVNKYQGNKYVKTFTCWNHAGSAERVPAVAGNRIPP